jgi:hypothetical protein
LDASRGPAETGEVAQAAAPEAGCLRQSPVEQHRDALVTELVQLRSVINAAEARCARITKELTDLEDGHPLGCVSATQFLSWQAGLSNAAAKALIAVGERFEELTSLRDAAAAGELSVWQARAIASAAVDDDEAAGLVQIARHSTCAQLETAPATSCGPGRPATTASWHIGLDRLLDSAKSGETSGFRVRRAVRYRVSRTGCGRRPDRRGQDVGGAVPDGLARPLCGRRPGPPALLRRHHPSRRPRPRRIPAGVGAPASRVEPAAASRPVPP